MRGRSHLSGEGAEGGVGERPSRATKDRDADELAESRVIGARAEVRLSASLGKVVAWLNFCAHMQWHLSDHMQSCPFINDDGAAYRHRQP